METFSVLLTICAGNSPVSGEFSAQKPVTRGFGVFFDLCLTKRLNKKSWGWWFETPSTPLWRHCNETHEWKSSQYTEYLIISQWSSTGQPGYKKVMFVCDVCKYRSYLASSHSPWEITVQPCIIESEKSVTFHFQCKGYGTLFIAQCDIWIFKMLTELPINGGWQRSYTFRCC